MRRAYDTVYCLMCRCRANSFTGHVHRGDSEVTAGWCSMHRESRYSGRKPRQGCQGCYGTWRKKDGVQEAE